MQPGFRLTLYNLIQSAKIDQNLVPTPFAVFTLLISFGKVCLKHIKKLGCTLVTCKSGDLPVCVCLFVVCYLFIFVIVI